MSREPYRSRDTFDDDISKIENELADAPAIETIPLLVRAVCVLARCVADVADAVRNDDR